MCGKENMKNEYQLRLHSYSTYITHVEIQPIQDGKQLSHGNYPLFFNVNRLLLDKLNQFHGLSKNISKLAMDTPDFANKAFIKQLLIEELQSTNEIESVESTKNEIANALNGERNRFKSLVN